MTDSPRQPRDAAVAGDARHGGGLGTAAKSAAVLLAAGVLTLGALLLAGLGLRSVDDRLGALCEGQLPALEDTLLLLRETGRLAGPAGGRPSGAAPDPEGLAAARMRIRSALARLRARPQLPASLIEPIEAHLDRLFAALASSPRSAASTAADQAIAALQGDLEHLSAALIRRIEQDGAVLRGQLRSRLVQLALVPALLLLALATYLYLGRALLKPVVALCRAMQEPRGQDLPPTRDDELGALVRASRETLEALARRESELSVARTETERASHANGLFLARISHELRTPLHALLGFAELLRQRPETDPEGRRFCLIIERNGRHLLRLIDDLPDLAATDAGRPKLAIAPTDLHRLLDELGASTALAARAKGIELRSVVEPGFPRFVLTDEHRLRQVLTKLLDNAVKYTERGGVTLAAAVLPPRDAAAGTLDPQSPGRPGAPACAHIELRFRIEDTGPGIPPAEQARLFEPFEQLHPGESGSGLGLAIGRQLAEALGGRLHLASEPGRGCRMTLDLPVQPVGPRADADADIGAHRGTGAGTGDGNAAATGDGAVTGYLGPRRRILVVDDDPTLRLLLRHQLGGIGFLVDCADGAETALEAALRARPDLVLMDMAMPDCCGYAAAHMLRERLGAPSPRMIAVSGTLLEDPADVRTLGFDGFLAKPAGADAVLAAVGRALGLHWQRGTSPAGVRCCPRPPPETVRAPARLEIEVGLELAAMAAWSDLEDWCTDLESGDSDYAGFVAKLRELAAVGDPAALLRWLRAHL